MNIRLRRMAENQPLTGCFLCDWVIVVDLDFDPTLWCELGNDNAIGHFFEDDRVGFSPQTVIECVEVGSGNDVLQVSRLGYVEQRYSHFQGMEMRLTSLESKVNGSGARLGPLQNGCPEVVTASFGKLYSS